MNAFGKNKWMHLACSNGHMKLSLISAKFNIKLHSLFPHPRYFLLATSMIDAWKLRFVLLVKRSPVFIELEASAPFLMKLQLDYIMRQVNSSHSPYFSEIHCNNIFLPCLVIPSSLFLQILCTKHSMLFQLPYVWYIYWLSFFTIY